MKLPFFRTDESKKTRLHIGGGIRLELVGEGDLYLECLSNYSVFVESFYLDAINNRAQGSTVHKFSSGANTKVRYKSTTWPFLGLNLSTSLGTYLTLHPFCYLGV